MKKYFSYITSVISNFTQLTGIISVIRVEAESNKGLKHGNGHRNWKKGRRVKGFNILWKRRNMTKRFARDFHFRHVNFEKFTYQISGSQKSVLRFLVDFFFFFFNRHILMAIPFPNCRSYFTQFIKWTFREHRRILKEEGGVIFQTTCLQPLQSYKF